MPRRPDRRPVVTVAVVLAVIAAVFLAPTAGAASSPPAGLHVSGNRLVDAAGTTVVLRGVNRSGTEYQCIHGYGIFDGPSDDASIAAMASWKINAVRVPLNEDCWLGINGAPAAYSGANYRSAIRDYVTRLHAAGLVAIVELHWTAPGTNQASGQQNMPDADHAPAFWTSVATTFKGDGSTVFDLFNEPFGVSWSCWRDGGDCGIGYQVAGMQRLVSTVRATGATNPVLLGGLAYANDLSQWNAFRPNDPTGNLMASWHGYNFNSCSSASCWDSQLAPVAASVPLVAGEIGENDCAHGYIDAEMAWLDAHRSGYLGWGWDTFDCRAFPALISSYDGAPTAYGLGLRDHLAAVPGGSSSPTATRTPTPSPSPTPTTSTTPTTTSSPSTSAPADLAVSPGSNTSSAPWWWEDDLDLKSASPITALTITVIVPVTPGVRSYGLWTNGPGGALTLTSTSDASALTYRVVLNAGSTLPAGYALRMGSQYSGNGTAHAVSTDSYTVTATVGGQRVTSSGHFPSH